MTSKIVNFESNYHTVTKDKVVTIAYALFDATIAKGVDESANTADNGIIEYRNNLRYLHGGYEQNLPKLQQAIEGFRVGMDTEVILEIDEAYGPHDPDLVITDTTEAFPPEARQVGSQLQGESADGQTLDFIVTRVEDGMITVDANHPLAGKRLRFVVEVKDIRPATAEEISAGCALKNTP